MLLLRLVLYLYSKSARKSTGKLQTRAPPMIRSVRQVNREPGEYPVLLGILDTREKKEHLKTLVLVVLKD